MNIIATIANGVRYVVGGSTGSTTPSLADYYDSSLVESLGDLVTTVLGWVTANPILALFFTMTMIGFAFVLIKWLKGVIRIH